MVIKCYPFLRISVYLLWALYSFHEQFHLPLMYATDFLIYFQTCVWPQTLISSCLLDWLHLYVSFNMNSSDLLVVFLISVKDTLLHLIRNLGVILDTHSLPSPLYLTHHQILLNLLHIY